MKTCQLSSPYFWPKDVSYRLSFAKIIMLWQSLKGIMFFFIMTDNVFKFCFQTVQSSTLCAFGYVSDIWAVTRKLYVNHVKQLKGEIKLLTYSELASAGMTKLTLLSMRRAELRAMCHWCIQRNVFDDGREFFFFETFSKLTNFVPLIFRFICCRRKQECRYLGSIPCSVGKRKHRLP